MTKKILMVDDDPAVLRLYRSVIESSDVEMLEARDGASALKVLESATPELFILDVMMPEVNGIELCQQIRAMAEHETTPILILSAWSDSQTVEQAFSAGANEYLVKPVLARDLRDKIRVLLGVGEKVESPGQG